MLKLIKKESPAPDSYYVEVHSSETILTAEINSVDDYYTPLKNILNTKSVEILNEIKTSGLRGRGGAGFPMGLKLESCANTESDQNL